MCGSVFDICILEFQRLTLSASHISQNHAPALYWSVRKEFFAKKSTEREIISLDLCFSERSKKCGYTMRWAWKFWAFLPKTAFDETFMSDPCDM